MADVSSRDRLLEEEERPGYRESCPGCRIELLKNTHPRVPYKLLFYVWIIVLCAGSPRWSLLCLTSLLAGKRSSD